MNPHEGYVIVDNTGLFYKKGHPEYYTDNLLEAKVYKTMGNAKSGLTNLMYYIDQTNYTGALWYQAQAANRGATDWEIKHLEVTNYLLT